MIISTGWSENATVESTDGCTILSVALRKCHKVITTENDKPASGLFQADVKLCRNFLCHSLTNPEGKRSASKYWAT